MFIGSLLGSTSPVTTHTRCSAPNCVSTRTPASPSTSTPISSTDCSSTGAAVSLEGVPVPKDAIGYTGIGARTLRVTNDGDAAARLVLLGGTPFAEELVMFWNFLGRSSEEIQRFRDEWQAGETGSGASTVTSGTADRTAMRRTCPGCPRPPCRPPLRPRRTTPPHARSS